MVYQYIDITVHLYTDASTGAPVHRYDNTQVQGWTGKPVHLYTSTRVRRYTGALVYMCTNTLVYRYAGTPIPRDTDTPIYGELAALLSVYLSVSPFFFRPRWRYCSRVTGLPLQRCEECVCLCSASSINMKIYNRVTRFVTLRNLFVSHELLVTSSESVDVTTNINSAGSPSDIRGHSDWKCIHVTCLSHESLSSLYLFRPPLFQEPI